MKCPLQTEVGFHINLPLLSSLRFHIVCACMHMMRERQRGSEGKRGTEEQEKGKEARTGNAMKNFLISCIISFDTLTFQPFTCIEFCFISIR